MASSRLSRIVPWRTARLIYLALWPVGISLSLLGLVGDSSGIWLQHGFLLNLLSALAGFCFGAPVVLSLFKRVTDQIESEQLILLDANAEIANSRAVEQRREALEREALRQERLELSEERANLEQRISEERANMLSAFHEQQQQAEGKLDADRRKVQEFERSIHLDAQLFLDDILAIRELASLRMSREGLIRGKWATERELIKLADQLESKINTWRDARSAP
ncbi:MAG: hypothetical protein LCH77_03030 [Actinobacteria bacterium]|nr:hypothetical protein [Actinomycetota bacterium]